MKDAKITAGSQLGDAGVENGDGRFAPLVLVVEDHTDTAEVIGCMLEYLGCRTRLAGSIAAGLELLRGQHFDLLICDLGLPDGDGAELMRQARAVCRDVPGIALTGYGLPADVSRSRAAGFIEHILKPVDFVALEQVLERVLPAHRGGA